MNVRSMANWLTDERELVAWQGERYWSLSQLRYDVKHLSEQLERNDSAQRWAICVENTYLFVVSLLATLHSNKTPVILGHCHSKLLNEQIDLFDAVLSCSPLEFTGTTKLVESQHQHLRSEEFVLNISGNRLIEFYTSGSTGNPKRIIKSVAALDCEARLLAKQFSNQLTDCRFVSSVVPYHLYGVTFRVFLPMSLGCAFHADLIFFSEQLESLDPSYSYAFVSSPVLLKRLAIDNRASKVEAAIKVIFSAGGELQQSSAATAADLLGAWPDEIYGSTETGVMAWRCQQQSPNWFALDGVHFIKGEQGFHVFSPLIESPQGHRLDDNIIFNDDGSFHLAGRKDRIVKLEEKRISLTAVERKLLEFKGVKEAVVVPLQNKNRQSLGAILVLDATAQQQWKKTGKEQERQWRAELMAKIEPIAVPRYWRIVNEIPVNSMNKRTYAQLRELFDEA